MEGSLHRIIETQSQWVAGIFSGKYKLPDQESIDEEVGEWERTVTELDYNPMRVTNNAYIARTKGDDG
jgi:hypothetical protein